MNTEFNESRFEKLNPFFFMTFLYLFLGLFAALQTSLIDFGIIEGTSSISWVRIHFITIGVLTQLIFGYVPSLINSSEPIKTRWDIWILINTGLFTFFYGRSLPGSQSLIMIAGGALIFIATVLFIFQLLQGRQNTNEYPTHWFYLFASFFLLIGIIVGTGLWVDWSDLLLISSEANAKEVHIHANNWGFMTLVFTGLLLDIIPSVTNISIKWPKSINYILVLQIAGAAGLIFGPWFAILPLTIGGMIAFMSGTVVMLLNIILPLRGKEKDVGIYHIITAYFWIIIPLFVAPFVIFGFEGFDFVEPNAPQALIYGWVLQVGFAFIPYFLATHFTPNNAKLGGSYISLILVNAGGVFLWLSIFIRDFTLLYGIFIQNLLHGTAYVLWVLALIPIIMQSYKIINAKN